MLIEKCKHISRSNNIQIKLKSGTISCRHSNSHGNLLHRFYDYLANYYAQHCDPTRHLHRHGHRDYYGRRMCYLSSLMAVVLGVILLPLPQRCNAVGYSYTRFRGPVSGPEHRIYVRNGVASSSLGTHDHHPDEESHLDYVAKPEYEFAYGVEDTQAHILHNRNEMRDGDAVKGVYSVVDPDGTLRVVRYTADDVNGFQAEVVKNGISAIHGQLQKDTPAPSHIPTDYNNHYGYNRYPSLNSYSSDNYNNYQNPGYYYPATVDHVTPPTTTTSDNNYNNYQNYEDQNYEDPNVNPEDNVEHVNVEDNGEYHPQYEVHEEEPSSDDGNVKEEGENDNKKGGGGKKKDYDDDEEDEDGDDDDYDDSDELEDYDEAVKKNKGSDESDEYY
ncbi:transcription initiation factor IIA subunit 1-like [Musca domestica]|uniref:Transcription initiation factor IIA subunit 1-like n=1 Tax=Musca domestica TaxID=7370 RepID=A0ABM3UPF5_MUSDO|nr:transcription initiation factor IIA subunit 1-like [Musca domestica]